MTNHLADATSPYLLQHADNPVDWYPWGEEALRKAQTEQRPIFLSIGYSACHWCHVMAHESFENEQVAATLNEHFVSIKVDREERPDLDRIYMDAVQAMTGSGGWPLSVFLTPDGHPFHGGTYFPPAPRYGMPSFTDLLYTIINAWRGRREEIIEGGKRVVAAVDRQSKVQAQTIELRPETIEAAFSSLQQSFDQVFGGWGNAPKFPQPMILEFLLRYHHTTHNSQALQMLTQTLEAMARGGMYDQLGGGFHRYSVDNHWLTPHFEKMLCDNAQLARVYLHASQVTGNEFFRTIAEEILDYVVREMADPAGGFYSTQDADSEGEEGKFFLWTVSELHEALGTEADLFLAAYGVTDQGDFDGKNILHLAGRLDQRPAFSGSRRKLFAIREQRPHPSRDEKSLTSWNGLTLAVFAEAARVLGRSDYLRVAERNADFLLREVRQADGCLLHVWKSGKAKINGYLEDYGCLIEGLLELYQTTFDLRWYLATRALVEIMLTHFQPTAGVFWDTSDDHEALITRPRELQDDATPSGSSMAATTLLRLASLTGESRYVKSAHLVLSQMQPLMAQYPIGFGQWLVALDYALSRPREIGIIGAPQAEDTRRLIDACTTGYHPNQIVAVGATGSDASAIPLLQNRGQIDGHATAYVCINFACQNPITDPAELRAFWNP